jgi:hypothetical protein
MGLVRLAVAMLACAVLMAGCSSSRGSETLSHNAGCANLLRHDQAVMLRTDWTIENKPDGSCWIEIRELMSKQECRSLRQLIYDRLAQNGPPTQSWSALNPNDSWPVIAEWDFDDGSRIYYRQEPWKDRQCGMTIAILARKRGYVEPSS